MQFISRSPLARLTATVALLAWLLTCGPLCRGMETAAQAAIQHSSPVTAGHAHPGLFPATHLAQSGIHDGGRHPVPGHDHGCGIKATGTTPSAHTAVVLAHGAPLLLYTVPIAAVCRLSPRTTITTAAPRLPPLAVTSSLRI